MDDTDTTPATIDARREVGRRARQRLARREAGAWDEAGRGHRALATVLAQNAARDPELIPVRHGRMAASPWTYFRGAAAVMAADLASRPRTGLMVQLCGDAHVLNFGLWATPERQLSFDLRDFDETLPGPFEWDVMRLAASLQVLADDQLGAGAGADAGEVAVRAALGGYRSQLRGYARAPQLDIWYDQIHAADLVGAAVSEERTDQAAWIDRQAAKRTNVGAARKLTTVVDGHRHLVEAPPFRVHDDRAVAMAADVLATYRATLPEERRYLLDRFALRDVVRQVVGVGSVGMRVFLVLLEGSHRDDVLLLQIKQAVPSVYEPFLGPSRYPNHGQRVTVGRRFVQSATDIFVGWTRAGGIDLYVRQFRDMKVVPSGERVAPWLDRFALKCGRVLARAHATTGDPVAIDAYLGRNATFTDAMVSFARSYAGQNERDHAELLAAIGDGAIEVAPGW